MTALNIRSNLGPHDALRVGRMHATGDVAHPLVVHPHAAIALVLRGSASVWCGELYEIHANDVIILPEGYPHAMRTASGLELLGLALCCACVRSGQGRRLVDLVARTGEGACAVRRLSGGDAAQLAGLLEALGSEAETRRPGWESATDALLALVHVVLARAAMPDGVPALRTAWIGRALAFIASEATNGISLSDVARHVRRAPAHVAATVRAQTGRTVSQWIAESRLAVARQWLLHSDATIEQLAATAGYPSTSQFHRVFRKAHGLTPAAWRRLHVGGAAVIPPQGLSNGADSSGG